MSDGRPLFFHHVPKTGGSSLIDWIHRHTPAEMSITENGYLSLPFVENVIKEGLRPSHFIYGHPEFGVSEILRGKTRTITVLRDPTQHIISNYLHILRDSESPMHAAARSLGFKRFIETHKRLLVYQTGSLLMGLHQHGWNHLATNLADSAALSLPRAFEWLDELCLVGTLENIDEFLFFLAAEMDWSTVPQLQRLNPATPEKHEQIQEMREILAELERNPELSLLLSIEKAVYFKALSLGKRPRRNLIARHLLESPTLPLSPLMVRNSENGQIVLGDNFYKSATLADGTTAWWTGDDRLSRFHVRFAGPSRKVSAQILTWHFVGRGMVNAFVDGRQVPATTPNGSDRLEIDLGDVARPSNSFIEVVMRIKWTDRLPDREPFYPALLMTKFDFR